MGEGILLLKAEGNIVDQNSIDGTIDGEDQNSIGGTI